ncbi:MAG: hypothetical protein ACEQSB_01280 [Undibacterium sp.]
MPKRFCIAYPPPKVQRTETALDALVGIEFETSPEAIAEIQRQFPYLPMVPSGFIAAPAKAILDELWTLRRYAAHQYWSIFAVFFPIFYIPVWCCEALDEQSQGT